MQETGGGPGASLIPPVDLFVSDADFAFFLASLATFLVSIQLFNLTTKILDWCFAEEKDAPRGDSGLT